MARPGPLVNRQNRVIWEEVGNKDTRVRAIARVEELLGKHQLPGLPSEIGAVIWTRFSILP